MAANLHLIGALLSDIEQIMKSDTLTTHKGRSDRKLCTVNPRKSSAKAFCIFVTFVLLACVLYLNLSSNYREQRNGQPGVIYSSLGVERGKLTPLHNPILGQLTCAVGLPPWYHLDAAAELKVFAETFANRPGDRINKHGASFFHYFALWCTVKALNPKVIVESGINKGIGSWFLRQAAGHDVDMIFISPGDPSEYRDESERSTYFTEAEFKDFSQLQWDDILPDPQTREETFIFFDDHQSGVRRVHEARELGFKHVMIDDNYLPGVGDNFSPKMVCRPSLYNMLGVEMKYLDNFGKVKQEMTAVDFIEMQTKFDKAVEVYAEFPPVWAGPTRFNMKHEIYDKATLGALFHRGEVEFLGLELDEEAKRYTHIAYIRLASRGPFASQ